MRTPSGELHIVDFKTEQIVASIQPKDYWNDKRHWEIKNNIDTLEFQVFDNTRHSSTLMQQNLVLKEVRDGRIVPYVITEIEKDSDDRSVIAYASGEWIQLSKAGIIPPQKFESKTAHELTAVALAGTKYEIGNIEYSSFRTMIIDEFIDPLSFLKKIASLFELEIQYRIEVVGNQIKRYVDMIKKRGRETGKEVTLGKDLIGIKRIENSQNICTALLGFVKKEGGEFVTIAEINKGIPYLVDSDAFQRWNEKGQHKFGFYVPETEDQDMDSKRLMTLMNTELKKRVNTSVSYEVEAQSIGRVFGLAHELINEGDTIRIKDTGFTPKLYLEARAIVGDESYKNPLQDKYVFGDYHEIVDSNEELRKIYNRILSSLGNKQEMIDQLDKLVKEANETASNAKKESEAAKTLAEKVQENLKNNTVEIIEAKNPPITGLKPYKTLWRDISNGKPGILKIWTGTAWESVVPDVESVKKETLEQVNKDIESTKTELNQKVQTVDKKAQEIAGQISDVKKEVQGKVDSNFVKEQIKDKADKSGVFTKDEINNGFVGKQIYETDKQGNVQKFKDVNTSIGQTNEALTQKAETSELTKTNDGLSQLEKKTNEIKTTAEGTKQTLTELQTKVDNTKYGVRNFAIDGSFENDIASVGVTNGSKNTIITSPVFNGKRALKVDTIASTIEDTGFSMDIRNLESGVEYIACIVIAGENDYTDVLYRIARTDWGGVASRKINVTKTWKKEYLTFKATAPTMKIVVLKKGVVMFLDAVSVYKGNVELDWSPSPEEMVNSTDFTKKTVEIETTIKGINTSVSNVQNEQGKLTERVTKSEQTADGFKTSIESLTKKDTEISNKLNTVEQTAEGTKKTISDVQQTTNDLKKTTAEITEQAGKISEKLTTVETKVNSDKAGGRNLLLDSNAKYEKTDYLINVFSLTENFVAGEEYTFVIKGSVPAGQKFGIWMNGGSSNVGYATSVYANGITYVTFKSVAATNGNERKLSLYNFPSNTTKSVVEWVALYKGNKPQDWTPAPENQVTIDEFTKKTTDIEKSVEGVKTTVTNVQNSQAGFDKRMTTVEQTASGLSSTVSTLNNVVDTQGKKLTEANTKLEQQATAIGAKVELKQVENYVAGFKIPELKQTVDQNKKDLLGELANKLATEQFNQKMTLIDNRFYINEQGINAAAKKTEVYTRDQANGQFATDSYVRDMESRLQLTEKGVSISVKENGVIAAFNMSKENITLNAGRINLVGFITANHIKGQVLEGVTLKTSGNRFVEINKQDMKIFDLDKPRGYMGFMETDDGSIQPALVLGSDNRKFSGTGSFYIYQKIPRINGTEQPSKAFATFGLSKGENAAGTNIWSSYIQMQNDGGHLYAYADGRLYFDCLNDIVFNSVGWAPGYGKFMVTTTEPHYFTNNYGEFNIQRKGSGNKITFLNGVNDHDLVMGRVMIRSSLASGYDTGLQIKDTLGNAWRDIELRTLRAKENISATGGVWAREFIPNSSRKIKTNIEDLQFSALKTLNSVRIKKYNMISDVEKYDAGEIDVLPVYYGMIAEDSDSVFTTPEKNAVTLYSSVSITMQSVQELDWKADNMQFDIGMVKQALEAEKREKVFIQDQLYELKDLVVHQEDRIAKLEKLLLQQLIDKKPEQL